MPKKNIVTPEIILQKFFKRLKKKSKELDFLICSNKQFEQWLHFELVLAMSDFALPVVYNDDYKEIVYQYSDGVWEQICDIATEYPMRALPYDIRPDICIAEEPFLLKYADKKTWQIKDDHIRLQCENDYSRTKYHYIELKQLQWVGINDTDIVSIVMNGNLRKYFDQDWETFKTTYNPSSIISLCFVPFWNPEKPTKKCSAMAIRKAIKKIRAQTTEECEREFGVNVSFVHKCIVREYCLLLLVYKL